MHKVTDPPAAPKPLYVEDCKAGEYVIGGDRYYLVVSDNGVDGVVRGRSLDGKTMIVGAYNVRKPPPGTVITIVVGGEPKESHAEQVRRKQKERDKDQLPGVECSSARQDAEDIMAANIRDLKQQGTDTTLAEKRVEQFKTGTLTKLTDAEFLDLLRSEEIAFEINTYPCGYFRVSLGHYHGEQKVHEVRIFTEAVQWLREQVGA